MSFKSGFESRESRLLTQQEAVSSKSVVRQCWTIVWQMMSVEMAPQQWVGRRSSVACAGAQWDVLAHIYLPTCNKD